MAVRVEIMHQVTRLVSLNEGNPNRRKGGRNDRRERISMRAVEGQHFDFQG